jgi:hypothetical protein
VPSGWRIASLGPRVGCVSNAPGQLAQLGSKCELKLGGELDQVLGEIRVALRAEKTAVSSVVEDALAKLKFPG